VILKRFRQTVLAAACSGRLTADWRENNPSPTNYAEEELPLSWRTVLIGEVIESLKYGTSKKCSYEKIGVPILRIPNIEQGVVTHSDLKYAELQEKEFQQLRLRSGDILMIRSNGSVSLVGKSALVRDIDVGLAYAGYLIRLRPDSSKIIPDFLNMVLGSNDVRVQIEVPARSTSGVHNINSKEVRALQFFLPPLPEQREIVCRVESMFKLADAVEKRVEAAKVMAEKLTQAILAKAFRGELVPTEAELARLEGRTYKSASELLSRIKSETHSKEIKVRQKK
jgi:type I restriction enzyme S subunit